MSRPVSTWCRTSTATAGRRSSLPRTATTSRSRCSIVERLNPLAGGNNLGQASSVTNQRQWLPQSRCNEAGVLGCDRNGDLIPQLNEIGPSPGYVLEGVNALMTPICSARSPTSTASSSSVSCRRRSWCRRASCAARRAATSGNRNTAAPPSTWIGPLTVTEVTSGRVGPGVESWHGRSGVPELQRPGPRPHLPRRGCHAEQTHEQSLVDVRRRQLRPRAGRRAAAAIATIRTSSSRPSTPACRLATGHGPTA